MFPDITAEGLTELLNEEYGYYVIDFGCEFEECLAEYLRCKDKIVVAQLTEWRLDELEQFQMREKETHRQSRWHYFYNLNTEKQSRKESVFPGRGISVVRLPVPEKFLHSFWRSRNRVPALDKPRGTKQKNNRESMAVEGAVLYAREFGSSISPIAREV